MHKPFVLETDANAMVLEAVLLHDGHLVAFESKKLNRAQQNYSAHEQELLQSYWLCAYGGIICMVQNLRSFFITKVSNGLWITKI